MKKLPDLLFIVDPVKEINAALEARKLGIPIVALVDTYSNPELADFVIPGNDRGINSLQLVISTIANAVAEAKGFEVQHFDDNAQNEVNAEVEFADENLEAPEELDDLAQVEVLEEANAEVETPAKEETIETKALRFAKTQKKNEDLSGLTLVELKALAKERNLKGYSALKKDELLELLSK